MGITHFFKKAFYLYYDGFRQMTLGKTLWMIILLKLFIMFAVLKVFFFPNYIGSKTQHGGEPTFVNEQLKQRMPKWGKEREGIRNNAMQNSMAWIKS